MDKSINRDKAIQELNKYYESSILEDDCTAETVKNCINIIKEIGSYDVAPVAHGKWEKHLMPLALKCSNCGQLATYKRAIEFNYCPKCGSKMDW